MDTYILLDCDSWECQSKIYDLVVDVLWHNQIPREVRAFDNEIFILRTTLHEHEVIKECIAINVPVT